MATEAPPSLTDESALQAGATGGAGANATSGAFPTVNIPPSPSQILQLPLERAQILATLPRSKLGDTFWHALAGVVGSAPGAAKELHDAYLTSSPAGLGVFGLIEVACLIIFLTWLAVSFFAARSAQTSLQYLDLLRNYGLPAPSKPS
jgi:hypothetical protein